MISDHVTIKEHEHNFTQYKVNILSGTLTGDSKRHTHDFYEVTLVVSGEAKYHINDYVCTVKPGDVYVVKERSAHWYSEVSNLEIIILMYYPDVFSFADAQLLSLPGFISLFILKPEIRIHKNYPFMLSLSKEDMDYVTATTKFIRQEIEKETKYPYVVKLYVFALFAYLTVKFSVNYEEPRTALMLSQALRYMQDNMDSQINIPDIAAKLYVSERHLSRIFRECFDCTPGDYLTKMRMNNALKLLSKGNMKIEEVAALCGYEDPAYFSRIFKKSFGISPRQARLLDL